MSFELYRITCIINIIKISNRSRVRLWLLDHWPMSNLKWVRLKKFDSSLSKHRVGSEHPKLTKVACFLPVRTITDSSLDSFIHNSTSSSMSSNRDRFSLTCKETVIDNNHLNILKCKIYHVFFLPLPLQTWILLAFAGK